MGSTTQDTDRPAAPFGLDLLGHDHGCKRSLRRDEHQREELEDDKGRRIQCEGRCARKDRVADNR
jgi:hypothetical protein